MCYNYSEKLVSYTLRLLQGFGADYGSQNMRVSCLRNAESAGIPDAADDRQGMGIYHSKYGKKGKNYEKFFQNFSRSDVIIADVSVYDGRYGYGGRRQCCTDR